jgi:hypothetical protein
MKFLSVALFFPLVVVLAEESKKCRESEFLLFFH